MSLDLETLLDQNKEQGIWDLQECSLEEGQVQEQKIRDPSAQDQNLQGLQTQDPEG